MTLVIGKVVDGEAVIVSDSKLSFEREDDNPYTKGCVKIYQITNEIVVAFADSVGPFSEDLPLLKQAKSVDCILDIVKKRCITEKKYELLIAELGRDKIIFIRNGEITESPYSFIGSRDGFDEFRKHVMGNKGFGGDYSWRSQLIVCNSKSECGGIFDLCYKLIPAMYGVCYQGALRDIGGVVFCYILVKDISCFLNYTFLFNRLDFEEVMAADGPCILGPGTCQDGGFHISVGSHSIRNQMIEYIHIHQSKFCLFYYPDEFGLNVPKKYECVNSIHWQVMLFEKLGVRPRIALENIDDILGAAMYYFNKENWANACRCCEFLKEDRLKVMVESEPDFCDHYLSLYCSSLYNNGQFKESLALLNKYYRKMKNHKFCDVFLSQVSLPPLWRK